MAILSPVLPLSLSLESLESLVSLAGFSERIHQVRLQARALRRAVDELDRTTSAFLAQAGLQPPRERADVIDVGGGRARALAKRALVGLAALAALFTLGGLLVSFGVVGGVAVATFLVLSRVLGVRVDVRR